jgi:uncharacterized protein YciI
MLFIALFEDDPSRISVREALMTEHLAFLDREAARIRVAGSLRETIHGDPVGACWIVDAADAGTVEALCHADPFWRGGLRRKLTVLHWSKAFEDRLTPV